jgi:hypothetical protein
MLAGSTECRERDARTLVLTPQRRVAPLSGPAVLGERFQVAAVWARIG